MKLCALCKEQKAVAKGICMPCYIVKRKQDNLKKEKEAQTYTKDSKYFDTKGYKDKVLKDLFNGYGWGDDTW